MSHFRIRPVPLTERMKKLLLHKIFTSRPHLSIAIAFGALVAWWNPGEVAMMTRALIAWNAAVWSYLIAMMWVVAGADHRKVRKIADKQDENAGLILVVLLVGAVQPVGDFLRTVRPGRRQRRRARRPLRADHIDPDRLMAAGGRAVLLPLRPHVLSLRIDGVAAQVSRQ